MTFPLMSESADSAHRGGSDGVGSVFPPLETLSTNAVNRGLSDLHLPTWLGLLAANITARTIIFHPLQLSVVRKRVTRAEKPPSVFAQIRAAYKGGVVTFSSQECRSGSAGARSLVKATVPCDLGRGGVRGCYRGLGAALVANLIGEVSYLLTLESFMENMARSSTSFYPNTLILDHGIDDTQQYTTKFKYGTQEKEGFCTPSISAALGAMLGDLVSLIIIAPVVIICNRQMTAGYGMTAGNRYQSIFGTFSEVWNLHQVNPKSVAMGTRNSFCSGATCTLQWLWFRNGFKGIYQGFNAGLLRIPSSGCWWAVYTKTKEAMYTLATPTLNQWKEERASEEIRSGRTLSGDTAGTTKSIWQYNWFLSPTDNPLLNATASTVASVITTVLFNPIAVIQTRLQVLPDNYWNEKLAARSGKSTIQGEIVGVPDSKLCVESMKSRSTIHPFKRIHIIATDLVQKEGLRAFFKGASVNVAVAVLDGLVFSLIFEFTKLGSDKQFITNNLLDQNTLEKGSMKEEGKGHGLWE
ncbi:unnamed protein product [Phytomonas sp. EM1]|nr:unnamed protein product [Phytomonas sp. EM1]|eukprot:CCW61269.1 unnamed protein product [Phytomonas sp. isolate EM1]